MSEPTPPAERWVIAVTPIGAGGPPMAVRMKKLIKHALRAQGLKCELLPDPEGVRAPEPAAEPNPEPEGETR